MTLHLFRETTGGDWYAAKDLAEAKYLFKLTDEDAEPTEWVTVPDDKALRVDLDGTWVTKTAAEWANDGNPPGYRFGVNY
jgi:hypothetical protein